MSRKILFLFFSGPCIFGVLPALVRSVPAAHVSEQTQEGTQKFLPFSGMGHRHISGFPASAGAAFLTPACLFPDLLTCHVGPTQISHSGPIWQHGTPLPRTCQLCEGRDVISFILCYVLRAWNGAGHRAGARKLVPGGTMLSVVWDCRVVLSSTF